jgi:hypothetical protein
MGFGSFTNNLGKGVIKAGKNALGIAGDPEEQSAADAELANQINTSSGLDWNLVDLENPDGVLNTFQKSNIRNILVSSAAQDDTGSTGAINKQTIIEPVPGSGNSTTSMYVKDVDSAVYKSTAAGEDGNKGKGGKEYNEGPRPYSVFNKFSLVNYRGSQIQGAAGGYDTGSGIYSKIPQEDLINPTATKIIEITSKNGGAGYRYDYSDFALVRYYNKLPNNQMITLRRFAFPITDDIITPKVPDATGNIVDNCHPDIARAVTYLGEVTGNSVQEIVKFSYGYNWKDVESDIQTIQSPSRAASSGKFGAIVNGSNFLSAAANASAGRGAVESNRREQHAGHDVFKDTYPNHVFGPLNIIRNTAVRDKGLTFEQEFTLKFEYELRSFGNINPKILMLDQLANILTLTSSTAPFWGGAVRYFGGGGGVARPLGNLSKLQSGDYSGFMGSIVKDMGSMFKGVGDDIMNLAKGKDSKLLNNLVGGGLMKMFNTPQGGEIANALLTGDPTGQWHVTIGNPLNPIMVIGNLTCRSTDIQFEGANSVQDFPERMIVTIKLKPGRPRDKAEIESMFNAGRGRFYLQPNDEADVNATSDTSAYGNKDIKGRKPNEYINKFRKLANG